MPPFLAGLFSTWFGFGRLRPAPGTWGSAAALPLAWLAAYFGGTPLLLVCAAAVTILGIVSADAYCRSTDKEDPSEVVIDEVAGQMFALALVEPSIASYAFGFLFFRGFDILKPGPVGWADRKVKGGLGVMLDDVLAGLLAAACLYLLGKGTGWWTTI